MSNTLAIAAVTQTLATLITPKVSGINGASGVPGRPDEEAIGADHVRIFLYHVEPNAAWRNCDLPTRRSNGELTQRPQVALNLQYLLTFFGDERTLVPQRLLARTVLALHEQPLLSRDLIQRMIAAAKASPGSIDDYLIDTDLAEQPELVRFTPLSLDLEALSKLWSVFFQTPYRLSVAYEASVVLISPDDTPSQPLPVREPRIYAVTLRRPVIERIVAAHDDPLDPLDPLDRLDPLEPITAGGKIAILGSQLRGETTKLLLAGKERDPETGAARNTETPPMDLTNTLPAEDLRDDAIRLDLPPDLLVGLVRAQIIHEMKMGESSTSTSRPAAVSNTAPLLLHPCIRSNGAGFQIKVTAPVTVDDLTSGNLEIEVVPMPAKGQQAIVQLNRVQPPTEAPIAYALPASPEMSGANLIFRFTDVVNGHYLVRVQIEGLESPLITDKDATHPSFGQYIAPLVTIP